MSLDRDKLMAKHREWQGTLKDALLPLLSQDGVGVVAARVFYVMRDKDGTKSAGNVGATIQGREEDGVNLLRSILTLLMDPGDNRTFTMVEAPKKN